MSDNEPKIRQLPGRRVTPETLLAMALEDCRDTKIAIVVTLDNDDLCDIVCSRASIAELVYMARCLDQRIDDIIRGKHDRGEMFNPDGTPAA